MIVDDTHARHSGEHAAEIALERSIGPLATHSDHTVGDVDLNPREVLHARVPHEAHDDVVPERVVGARGVRRRRERERERDGEERGAHLRVEHAWHERERSARTVRGYGNIRIKASSSERRAGSCDPRRCAALVHEARILAEHVPIASRVTSGLRIAWRL